MIRIHAGLFVIHVRLHAPDLLPEIHSLACITAIAHKQNMHRGNVGALPFWLTPSRHKREAPG